MKFSVLMLAIMSTSYAYAQERRTKIDFEDALVEGVNKQPLDSLSQISQDDEHKKFRLYRKRAGFKDLHELLIQELRNLQ